MSGELREDQFNVDNSANTFTSALWFNAILAVVFFGAFVVLRTTRPQTYAPRLTAVPKERRPPVLPKGFGRWIIALLKISDEDLIKTMGLDRFMILKLLRMGIITFSIYSIVAIPILFPIMTIGQGNQTGLSYLTMANIIDDNRTWANCLLACVLTCLVWYYTFRETKIYIELRRKYLLSPDYANTIAARTIYIPSIPKEVNNIKDLERIFEKFPGGIKRIWLNRELDDLPSLVEQRQKAATSLEANITKSILAVYKDNLKSSDKNRVLEEGQTKSEIPEKLRPMHRESSLPIPLPCFGKKVDSIRFYMKQIKELNEQIVEKQSESTNLKQVNSAFVEFNEQIAAHMAGQTLMHKRAMQMAPRYINIPPSDIIWENTNIRSFERMIRRFMSMTITSVIIIFWAVPVVFVQAVANLETLSKAIPFLEAFNEFGPTAVGIIQGILPAVALAVLIALVPIIFTILSTKEGIPQKSFVELSVLHKFFFFQLIDVVLVSTLSGGFMTIVAQLEGLAKNPLGVIDILSENLPKASTFFITFVMLQSTNQSGQTMLQLVPYILSYVKPLFSTTPRDIYTAKRTCPTVNLGTLIPSLTVIFVLGLEYGVIAPLILPFVCLYFLLQYFVYLYQFVYVYELDYETAGRHFPRAIRHIYIGLIISQVTLIGLFAIRTQARGQLALMIVALILTSFVLYYYDRAFKPLFKYLPISSFDSLDHKKNDDISIKDDANSEALKSDVMQVSIDEKQKLTTVSDDEHSQPGKSSHIQHDTHSFKTSSGYEAYQTRQSLVRRLEEAQLQPSDQIENMKVAHTARALYDAEAYMHPSTYMPAPTIWLPQDDLGIAEEEIKELKTNKIDGTTKGAAVLRKDNGKGYVVIDEQKLIVEDEGAPGLSPSAINHTDVNNYVRYVVDGLNFSEAISSY